MNATIPKIHRHPINLAATARLKKEGQSPATFQELPILNLARLAVVPEGQEDEEAGLALVAVGVEEMEAATEAVEAVLTPQEILTMPLKEIGETVLSEMLPSTPR